MAEIFKSASKVVFLLLAIALIAGMFVGKVDPKDFITLTAMAFTFYFTKQNPPTGTL